VPYDVRVGSGISMVSAQSVGQRGRSLSLGRISAAADRNACGVVFKLPLRAGRIAPGT
jgi:hypothetical protein